MSSSFEKLQSRKIDIENEIKELSQILVDQGNVGMSGNLIDSEGFPRSDIDIYKIRTSRQQINCLLNDHKQLMKEIEVELNRIHYANASQVEANKQIAIDVKRASGKPFIKITQVDQHSPSYDAGLLAGDQIVQFGPFIYSNTNKNLSEIADHVRKNEDKIILLKIVRTTEKEDASRELTLKLIPKKWNGHGLLGCKLIFSE